MLKPWREIAVPHRDVLEGTFQQSEFAADITAVHTGKATREYQDAAAFFERTFITDGMQRLLLQVLERLAGRGGEPVIQLQTSFGGGKTHTLLAVYHLASRKGALADLTGIPALLDKAGLLDVPQARVAVIDGNALSPGQPWQRGSQQLRTLWGELAWQLGGEEAFALVREADESGTSPGKDVLRTVLEGCGPCVVLLDELLAYVRQFGEGKNLSGGSLDSNLSFLQALTEAVKLAPRAILLASLPESEVEAGSQQQGMAALRALEKTFGRVQALWKPVATEESFEIVRRRLFEPIRDEHARGLVCRAFAETYIAEGAKLPGETQETRYAERLERSYPFHPEIFDRLYEDWATLDNFQRTRGVLKLMAKVIYRLWQDDNKDLMIMPASLPLSDGGVRNELTYLLLPGWDPVVDKDIDGERAETTELENREPRFGAVNAARRVARTIFLGSAPASVATKTGIRGLDRARVLLGCLQAGQTASTYGDALNRLADRLHYLNSSGDKGQDTTRFWFDIRANLRREMEERKNRFDDKQVRGKLAEVLKKMSPGATFFAGVHVFTPHSDVPDDSALRLVVLPPQQFYARKETRPSFDAVLDYVRNNGAKPRLRGNRLLFLALDFDAQSRVIGSIRTALAWSSIVDDISETRLVLDTLQVQQARKEREASEGVLPQVAREAYKWLLCPGQENPSAKAPAVEAFALNTGGSGFSSEIERVCLENELVISAWSPIHLRNTLKALYWKDDRPAIRAMVFWEDSQRYLYLPRLKDREVLGQTIRGGAASRDFFGTAYGESAGHFAGFQFGVGGGQLDDTLLLIEPGTAARYEEAHRKPAAPVTPSPPGGSVTPSEAYSPIPPDCEVVTGEAGQPSAKAKSFHGTAQITANTAKTRLVELADEIIAVLCADPNASVNVTLEISADFSNGVADGVKRAVSENARILGLKNADWE